MCAASSVWSPWLSVWSGWTCYVVWWYGVKKCDRLINLTIPVEGGYGDQEENAINQHQDQAW